VSTDQLTYYTTLVTYSCWCGIPFGLPRNLLSEYKERNVDHLLCPLGHTMVPKRGQSYPERLEAERTRRAALQDQLDAAERTRIALKGHLTRLRNRIANGVCPWCSRSFENVLRHVASKHPEHADKAKAATS